MARATKTATHDSSAGISSTAAQGSGKILTSIIGSSVQPADSTAEQQNEDGVRLKRREDTARRGFLYLWTTVAGIILFAVFIYLLRILSLPVSILVWTLIIVFCLRGIVAKLEKHGMNRGLGTTIAYVVMVVILAVILLLLFSPIFGVSNQFADLASSLPRYVDGVIDWANGIYERYSDIFDNDVVRSAIQQLQSNLSGWAGSIAQMSADAIFDAGTTIVNGLVAIGFAFVIAFWILMELPGIGREALRLIGPKYSEDAQFLHLTFTRVMGGYIKATLIQCACIGVACGIIFAIVKIPNAAALGVITGVMNIIPIIGPWLGGIVAAIVALFTSPIAAIIAVLSTIIVQQIVYTFVSPRLMANSVDIHPAVTFIALMGGSAIGGAIGGLLGSLVGMLAAIPLVAAGKAIFVYYFEKQTGRQVVSEDGVFFKGKPAQRKDGEVNPMGDALSPHPNAFEAAVQAEKHRAHVTDDFMQQRKRFQSNLFGKTAKSQKGASREDDQGDNPQETKTDANPASNTKDKT